MNEISSLVTMVEMINKTFYNKFYGIDFFIFNKQNGLKTIFNIMRNLSGVRVSLEKDKILFSTTWANNIAKPNDKFSKNYYSGWDAFSETKSSATKYHAYSFLAFNEPTHISIFSFGFSIQSKYGPDILAVKSSELEDPSINYLLSVVGNPFIDNIKFIDDINKNPKYIWVRRISNADEIINGLQKTYKTEIKDMGQVKRRIRVDE